MTNRLLHRLHFKIFRFSQILVIFAYFFNKFLMQICKISEIRTVQKDANLVDFEKC